MCTIPTSYHRKQLYELPTKFITWLIVIIINFVIIVIIINFDKPWSNIVYYINSINTFFFGKSFYILTINVRKYLKKHILKKMLHQYYRHIVTCISDLQQQIIVLLNLNGVNAIFSVCFSNVMAWFMRWHQFDWGGFCCSRVEWKPSF